MSEETPAAPVKRPRGRPRKNPVIERDSPREEMRSDQARPLKMRAKPNWETMDASAPETPDRYRIDPSLIPDGMSAQWVTDSVFGQGVPQHRSDFEKGGWTPVHQDDFDGQFNGMFMPKGREGEINVDGLVLMVRPKEITDKAKRREVVRAHQQVAIKEAALRGGDIPVSLDPSHPTAVRSNKVSKTLERVEIPKD